MIIENKSLYLYGKKIFERAEIRAPFKRHNDLGSEACFLHILEGSHNQYSGTEHIQADKEGGILMKCGQFIFEPIGNSNVGSTKLVAVHFHPEVIKKLFKDSPPKFLFAPDDVDQNMAYVRNTKIIHHYIESISILCDDPVLAEESILELKLKEIILILSKTDSGRVSRILNNLFNPTTVVFKDVIEAHLYSDLSIEDLANLTNNSLTSFKRKFKEMYRSSPANYIKNERLEKAAKLLKISDRSISEISFECAFNDVAHFSNSFKAKFDQTPSEFRLAQNSKS